MLKWNIYANGTYALFAVDFDEQLAMVPYQPRTFKGLFNHSRFICTSIVCLYIVAIILLPNIGFNIYF